MSFFLCLFLSRECFLIWGSEGRVRQGPNEQQPAGTVRTATWRNRRRGRYRGSLRTFGSQMRSAVVSCWAKMKKVQFLGLFLKTSTATDFHIWNMTQFTKYNVGVRTQVYGFQARGSFTAFLLPRLTVIPVLARFAISVENNAFCGILCVKTTSQHFYWKKSNSTVCKTDFMRHK